MTLKCPLLALTLLLTRQEKKISGDVSLRGIILQYCQRQKGFLDEHMLGLTLTLTLCYAALSLSVDKHICGVVDKLLFNFVWKDCTHYVRIFKPQ